MTQLPRGIRLNNPGNIRHGDKWQGLAATQDDPDFCRFVSPAFGLRAMMKLLLAYQNRHKLNTVEKIIGRWAPPVENDTGAYAAHVAKQLGVPVDATIKLDRTMLIGLAMAIARHENGRPPANVPPNWYPQSAYEEAVTLALGA